MIILGILISFVGLNQFDESMIAEVEKAERAFSVTPIEENGILLKLKYKDMCEKTGMNDAQFALLSQLTQTESYRDPEIKKSSTACLLKLANPLDRAGYLNVLARKFQSEPDATIKQMNLYLEYLSRTAIRGDTLVSKGMALSGLVNGLGLVNQWKISKPNLISQMSLPDLQKLTSIPRQDYWSLIRDSEVGFVSRSFFAKEVVNAFAARKYPGVTGIWKMFYLPNKTKNQFWRTWNHCIENRCEENYKNQLKRISFINPVGVAFIGSFVPVMEGNKIKINDLLKSVVTEYQKLTN